jgi:hypothetical protein
MQLQRYCKQTSTIEYYLLLGSSPAYIHTPGNYPKEVNILFSQHGESLKTRNLHHLILFILFFCFLLWPTNAHLSHKLSHSYIFGHYRVILSELVINTLPSYTSISCYDQQIHNYLTNYHTPTYLDITVSSSVSLWSIPCQVTQVFQMQLLVIQFKVKMFHTGFMSVLML